MKKDIISGLFVALLILLFSYTSASKLLDHHRFVFQLGMSPSSLVKATAPLISWILPAIEAVVAIGLLTKKYRIWALFSSLVLLISFEVYIIYMLVSGLNIPCTCGGVISKMTWNQHVIFNMIFILIAIMLLVFNNKNIALFTNLPKQANSKDISRA